MEHNDQATEQASRQAAQQAAQQVGQTDTSAATRQASTNQELNDTGMGERSQLDNAADSSAWRANVKRTYDEYQQESLSGIRENRELTARLAQNAVSHDLTIQNIATQALQNAVETANAIGKQLVRHEALATDQQWNAEPSEAVAQAAILKAGQIDSATLAAINAAIAKAIADALSKK